MSANDSFDQRVLTLTREYPAPRALVWECWSKAEHLEKWFGPDGFEVRAQLDFRPGGEQRIEMRGFGMVHVALGRYQEIVDRERIVVELSFSDIPDYKMVQTMTFSDAGPRKTKLVVRHDFGDWPALPAAHRELLAPRMAGAPIGWGQTLTHLGEHVAKLAAARG